VSAGVISFLEHERSQLLNSLRLNNLLVSQIEMIALEHSERGELEKAQGTIIERIFVGLTNLYPERSTLDGHDRDRLTNLVQRFTAFRERNPWAFAGREDWWVERMDGWAKEVAVQ
jgi:hypothetical protein